MLAVYNCSCVCSEVCCERQVESSQHAGVGLHPTSGQQLGRGDISEWFLKTQAGDAAVKMQDGWQSFGHRHVYAVHGSDV